LQGVQPEIYRLQQELRVSHDGTIV
jgi:hypothetical protein